MKKLVKRTMIFLSLIALTLMTVACGPMII